MEKYDALTLKLGDPIWVVKGEPEEPGKPFPGPTVPDNAMSTERVNDTGDVLVETKRNGWLAAERISRREGEREPSTPSLPGMPGA